MLDALVAVFATLALLPMHKIQKIPPTEAQACHDKYADYRKVSEIPPFHMGETITCEDREILITGFMEDSYGNFLIEGRKEK